jgi:cytoskeletal protein RodZ
MCGMPLDFSAAADAAPSAASWAESRAQSENRLSEPLAEFAASADRFEHPRTHQDRTPQSESRPMREQNLSDPGPRFQFQSELDSAPRSYRVYIGAVVAILFTVLLYMAWRGGAAFWSNVRTPAQVPQAVPAEQQAAAPQAQPSPVQNAEEEKTAASAAAPPVSNARSKSQSAATMTAKTVPKPRSVPRSVPETAVSAPPAAQQGGAEELATAEKFLDARPGAARDTREAAQWLWKAVAKQNATATFLLSDLYLRGDGVTKNCDQGRLLLDAAARKGVAAAAERLRHLQAFGCQ